MDEALKVDLWTLRLYREQLVNEDAPAEEWARYRLWRACVTAAARQASLAA